MSQRDQLVKAIAKAATLSEQARLVAALDEFDRIQAEAARQERAWDGADAIVRQTLTPVRTHEFHTASSEWLGEVDTSGEGYHSQVMAEAALWYGKTSAEVKADHDEFAEQARGMARRVAGKYGEAAPAAEEAALSYVAFLHRREAASTLDQVEQTVAPDGVTNKPTPLPPDVFDNFAPEVHPINEAVVGTEQSGRAPLLQEIQQLDGGQGQAELPNHHDTAPMPTQPSVALGYLYNLDEFIAREAATMDVTEGDPYPNDAQIGTLDSMGYTAPLGTADPVTVVTTPGNIGSERLVRQTAKDDGGVTCPTCKGTGAHPWDSYKNCPKCKGTGIKNKPRKQVADALGSDEREVTSSRKQAKRDYCRKCFGSGVVECKTCDGDGLAQTSDFDGDPDTRPSPCTDCLGTGYTGSCPRCDGQGWEPQSKQASRKQAVDGDSQSSDTSDLAGSYLGDQNSSSALAQLVEATGMEESEVRQKFPNPQAALELLRKSEGVRWYGGKPQAEDHDTAESIEAHAKALEESGNNNAATMVRRLTPAAGQQAMFAAKEAASGLDQIQQTTAPDGVTYKPTPMPPDVMFPIVQDWPEEVAQNAVADGTPAVEKAARMDDVSSRECRSCGGNLGPSQRTATGEYARKCTECGATNHVQEKSASAVFTPDDAMAHPEFRKGYAYAARWNPSKPLVTLGSAEFEAGLYAGITDNPAHQASWVTEHAKQAAGFPVFATRMDLHDRFTRKVAGQRGLRTQGAYIRKQAIPSDGTCPECLGHGNIRGEQCEWCKGTGKEEWAQGQTGDNGGPYRADFDSDEDYEEYKEYLRGGRKQSSRKTALTQTDLMTSGPGTSPSPVGDTPIDGPGRPGPLAGQADAAAPGGPAPYNGVEPLGQPVVPGAVPPAPANPEADISRGAPPNPFASAQTVAFRRRVQAGLVSLACKEG